jgi:hypothetical protein
VTTTLLYAKIYDSVSFGPGDPFYNRDLDLVGLRIAYTPSENHLIELFGGYLHFHYLDAGFVSLAYTGNINDMFDLKAEGGVVFGDIHDEPSDIFGWNLYLDASYYTDLMRVGIALLLLSGGDDRDNINIPTLNHFIEMGSSGTFRWGNVIGSTIDDVGLYSWWNTYRITEEMENLLSIKLYFEITPVEKLTINAAVIWARALEEWGVNADYYGATPTFYFPATTSRDLGWEIDLGVSYEIMEGLTYSFSGGVLFTGDAWDYDADGTLGPPYDREHWGEVWSVINELKYEF